METAAKIKKMRETREMSISKKSTCIGRVRRPMQRTSEAGTFWSHRLLCWMRTRRRKISQIEQRSVSSNSQAIQEAESLR